MTINKGFTYGLLAIITTLILLNIFAKPEYCTNVDEYAKKMKIESSVAEKHLNLLSIGKSRNSSICRDEISRTDS
jgi:predicted transcriptional regulator of viral defense system